MKIKKKLALLIAVMTVVIAFGACGGGGNGSGARVDLTYGEFSHEAANTSEFNRNLFYRNDLTANAADPSAIWVSKEQGGEELGGYFYMYGTSSEIGDTGYQVWRSSDLTNWICKGVAYQPPRDSWALLSYWAPEVIYDAEDKTYYMYYSGSRLDTKVLSMGLATSKSPLGPFVQYTDDSRGITIDKPLFDFSKMSADHPLAEKKTADGEVIQLKAIDPSPYKDPVSGKKYMYFSHDRGGDDTKFVNPYVTSSLYAMEMTDWATPDYATVKKITDINVPVITDEDQTIVYNKPRDASLYESAVNEGAFVIYREGKYYLTYSVNEYNDKTYQVRTAISDSPMGPFRKLKKSEGGHLLYAELDWDHAAGTGHHSFVTIGDELFIIYHAHKDRMLGGGARAVAADRVEFVKNSDGLTVPYVNGPTYSLQALPEVISGYKNIAPKATVTSDNTAEGSDVKYLNDGLVAYHDSFVKEFEAKAGVTTLTLTFSDYVTARALMVFNSFAFDKAFDKIASVEMDVKKTDSNGNEATGIAQTGALQFNWGHHSMPSLKMRPGGSVIIEFEEVLVKEIRIKISSPNYAVAISDIVVLGK